MNRFISLVTPLLVLPGAAFAAAAAPSDTLGPGVPAFTVRPGFRVTLAAEKLDEARFLEFDDKGVLYVSQPRGNIVALRDKDGDGVYETSTKFLTGKPSAHGMHWKNGWLWYSRAGAIDRARDTNGDDVADEVVTIVDKLPEKGHWWRSILVGEDSFYTSIGDSGNSTDPDAADKPNERDRQKIWQYNLDGSNRRLFASGLRNTEKLRFRPGTTEVWGADHNLDNFGEKYGEKKPENKGKGQPITDLIPGEEFNHYVQDGFYGHPFIVHSGIPNPQFENRPDILDLAAKTIPPAWLAGAHWAGNGWTFVTRDTFPGLKGDALVAYHGSWNSSKKVGYRIERILFDEVTGRPYGAQQIVGTLGANGNDVLARPCDVVEAPDGSLLFSCDQTKRIFRISRAAQ